MNFLHQTITLLFWIRFVKFRMCCDKMNAACKLIDCSPSSYTRYNLLFREGLTNILNPLHSIKVNITQSINHHFKFLSVQVINYLLHYFVLSHQDKNVVKWDSRFFEFWQWQWMLLSNLCYELLYQLVLLVSILRLFFKRCWKTHDLVVHPFM